jgi:hypothetical protein
VPWASRTFWTIHQQPRRRLSDGCRLRLAGVGGDGA